MACEVAARSDDVPPLQNYIDAIYAFRERISPGEITRRIHLEEWHRYMRTRDEETCDTQPQMDDMFAKIRTEIAGMERRIKEFKLMVDELVRMVGAMKGIDRLRQEGARRVRLRGQDGSVVSGYLVRGATRIPPHLARGPGGARRMVRSPTDLLPMPILANSRARLPPLISPPPPPPSPSPIRNDRNANNSSSPRRVPTSTPSSVSRSRPRQRQAAGSSAVISRTIIHSSSPSPPPTPPRPARNNIHRGFFRRVFHMSQHTDTDTTPLPPRTPSPSPVRSPSPLDSSPPSDPEFSRHASPSVSSIAETRARLPPSPEESPVPYRPPLFSTLNRL